MKKNKLGRRYLMFLIGLLLISFGLSLITKAALGTTPIASIPYTLSLIFPRLTLGNFMIITSIIFIILQAMILGKDTNVPELLLQVPMTIIMGYIVDFSMWVLSPLSPEIYIAKIISLLIGCVIIAMGVCFEVTANVTMLPPDGIMVAIARKTGKNFGSVKQIVDVLQALIAVVLGLVFLHGFAGVREGTVIGALLIGNIIKFLNKKIDLKRIFAI